MNNSEDTELELLKKALKREQAARIKLENKLDHYDQQQYEINQELLKSYESARIREVQLQFLAFLSSHNTESKSLDELIYYFADNIASLFNQSDTFIIKHVNSEIKKAWRKSSKDKKWFIIPMEDIDFVSIPSKNNQWIRRTSAQDPLLKKHFENKFSLSINFPISSQYGYLLTLVLDHYCYSDDFKQTLEIAAKQFVDAVEKKLTDVELSHNYLKLRSTLKALKSTQRQLMQSEKMASLGTLSAGVAHEINNPLSYLASNLDTLSEYLPMITEAIKNLPVSEQTANDKLAFILNDIPEIQEACIDGTKRIKDIVNSLLNFSRKEDEKFSPIDIAHPIDAALEIVHNKLKYKHQIDKQYQHKYNNILGNSGQLQQVFVNLIINASQAMKDGGELTIITEVDDNQLIVKVIDQGVGMDSKTVRRIFEPFFSTKTSTQGTGLGLSVSYAILTKHNAVIDIDSKVGVGTTFNLTFDLV